MSFGIENRLSKIFQPEAGKTVMLAVDHGYFQGPTTGLEDLRKTLAPLANLADCLFITRGMLRNCVEKISNLQFVSGFQVVRVFWENFPMKILLSH